MRPADLPLIRWEPPPAGPRTIVVLTGSELRHDRFALRILETFGDRVVAWYRLVPAEGGPTSPPAESRWQRGLRLWNLMARSEGIPAAIRKLPAQIRKLQEKRRILRRRERRQREVEQELFSTEVARLRARTSLQPTDVTDPHAPAFAGAVTELSPWLLLTLGGPLYRPPLLGAPRGGTINQHAGWSPDYRGTNTTDWALYHRRLDRIGNTVHLSATGADSGSMIRRSHPCLTPDDTPESIFARVVALGTELVIETVEELMQEGHTLVAHQPSHIGRTYLSRDLDSAVLIRTALDFEHGWLAESLERESRW